MSETNNPWLSRPAAEPDQAAPSSVVESQVPPPTGPTAPQRGIPAPDRVDQLPTRDRRNAADLWWLGTHGGAGESTLAELVSDWPAAEHAWPRTPGSDPARVVLVARSSMRGLRAAQAAATQWASGLVPYVEVLGLVIVADAPGRLPRPLREYARLVGGGVPRTWQVPWVEGWRVGQPVALTDAQRDVRRLVDELSTLTGLGATGTTDRKKHL